MYAVISIERAPRLTSSREFNIASSLHLIQTEAHGFRALETIRITGKNNSNGQRTRCDFIIVDTKSDNDAWLHSRGYRYPCAHDTLMH